MDVIILLQQEKNYGVLWRKWEYHEVQIVVRNGQNLILSQGLVSYSKWPFGLIITCDISILLKNHGHMLGQFHKIGNEFSEEMDSPK